MRILLGAFLALLLFGCEHTYEIQRSSDDSEKLNTSGSAYVALPNDGRFEQTVYYGSGKKTANAVLFAFSSYLQNVVIGKKTENMDQALKSANEGGFTYLIYPEILHWEDRATEWSGRQDRLMLKVTLANTTTGEAIDNAVLKGTSKWGTWGGDHPEDLLAEPLKNYAATLF